MNINIFGSTGEIGSKCLKVLKKYYPKIKIEILTANINYKKIIKQANEYNPKYIFIKDVAQIIYIKKFINKKIKVYPLADLNLFLSTRKSTYSILAISGYDALKYIEMIIASTKFLGLVNKECVVSAGYLIKKIAIKHKTKITPLDSEHYSLFKYFNNKNKNDFKKIFITASGGPFYLSPFFKIKNASFEKAKAHPKWKMGYKNSIDSATLVNKCLEVIEAHYLYDIPYKKLEMLIHPQALIHSIIEHCDFTSTLNYFYHDMKIPIINFLNHKNSEINEYETIKKFDFQKNSELTFVSPSSETYPVLKIFKLMDKNNHENLIKFNTINQFAVELFHEKKILFGDIHKIIQKYLSLDINFPINTLKNIIIYQDKLKNKLKNEYKKF